MENETLETGQETEAQSEDVVDVVQESEPQSSDSESQPSAKELLEQNKKLVQSLESMAQQMAEIKDFVGLSETEAEAESEESPDTTEPTAREAELAAQVQGYQEAMQAHVDATLNSLTEKQQQLIKKLGGDDPLAQFRALASLMEAGVLASETKPKTARGSHQGRADANGLPTKPVTRDQLREQLRKDLREAGLA